MSHDSTLYYDQKLIEAVKKREGLYDKDSLNYPNRSYIRKQWQDIGEELGVDGHVAKKKWTALRDYFNKCHNYNSFTGPSVKKRKWVLYDSLTFLQPHLTVRRPWNQPSDGTRTENYEDDSYDIHIAKQSPNSSERSYTLHPSVSAEQDVDDSLSHTGSTSGVYSPVYSEKTKTTFPNERTANASVDDPVIESIHSIKPTENRKDETDLYLQSLGPYLRELDPLLRIECQAEIQMLLLKFMRRNRNPSTHQPEDNSCVK